MVKVKICGLRTEAMLEAAIDAGADFIGLVHFAKSPRHVSLDEAARLARLAQGRVAVVLLLVDPDDALVSDAARLVPFDYLQLHGNETVARTAQIRAACGSKLIKAVKVATSADVAAALAYAAAADLLLFDAKPPVAAELPGGNGVPFDWHILDGLAARGDYMLSGGLDADNVAAALRLTGAPMVDVSSGVESAPGVKDEALIRRFIACAKAIDNGPERG